MVAYAQALAAMPATLRMRRMLGMMRPAPATGDTPSTTDVLPM
jgi:hypothetical protein